METRDCKFVNYRGRSRARSIYSPINSQHVIRDQKPKREGNEVVARAPASRSDRFQKQYCNRNLPINSFSSFDTIALTFREITSPHRRYKQICKTRFRQLCRTCLPGTYAFWDWFCIFHTCPRRLDHLSAEHRLAFAQCNKVLAKACRGNMRLCTTIKRQIQRECESRYQSRMNPSRIPD